MHKSFTTQLVARKPKAAAPDILGWSRNTELLTVPAIRRIAYRARVSPELAAVIAELAGYVREARHA